MQVDVEITRNSRGEITKVDAGQGHLVLTPPISGEITMASGEVVDVAPQFIAFETHAEAKEAEDLLRDRVQTEGHPLFPNIKIDHKQSVKNMKAEF